MWCIVLETTIYEILSAIDIDTRLNMDLEYDLDPPPPVAQLLVILLD